MASYASPATVMPVDVRLTKAIANAVFVLVGVVLLAAALAWLVRLPLFGIRAIRIEGDVTRNSVSTIRANALPKLAGNFFTMDLARSRSAFESVPWVRKAVVHRVWPNTLRVQLQEHHPAALWQGADGAEKLVNTEGEVFEANLGDVEDDGLPSLSGPDGSSAHVLAMTQRLLPLFERLDAGVNAVTLSGRGSWRVTLDTGAEVELGRGEDAEVLARAERFVRTVPQVTGRFQRPLEYADLRHADGYAVRLQGVTTTLPAAGAAAKARKH